MIKSGEVEGRDRRPFHSGSVFCESLSSRLRVCVCVRASVFCFFPPSAFITPSALKPKDYKNVWHRHGDHNKYL